MAQMSQLPRLADEPLPEDFPARDRVVLTTSCGDCDDIPKVIDTGAVQETDEGRVQIMHNGLRIVEDGYCGAWMTEVIRRLRGHHEPQEERLFHEVVQRLPTGATMFELGGYWAYYSLWMQRVVSDSQNVIVEPDPNFMAVGRKNFAINGAQAEFIEGGIGERRGEAEFECASDEQRRIVRMLSVDQLMEMHRIEFLDLLHADIQGAELDMLRGAAETIGQGRVRFLMISTHHHSISGDPLTHQRCCQHVRDMGATILCEHSVAESFSGDGLIVASFDDRDQDLSRIPISYNRAGNNVFREIEYDLADAWQARDNRSPGHRWAPRFRNRLLHAFKRRAS